MTLKEKTAPNQSETIELEFELRHRPEKVWRAITDPALLSEWLLPIVELRLEPGAAFRFKAPPQPGWDGEVRCTVVEVEPLRALRYRWVVGDLDTVVTFSLTPTEAGTRLVIVQTGFTPSQKHNFAGARYGLKMMGERLITLLDARAEDK